MGLEELKESIPEYAKDLKLNLSSAFRTTELNANQLWGTAVACAMACRSESITKHLLAEASSHLDETNLNAAKGASALMGMNNIYYRFAHLSNHENFLKLPSGLRMNFMRSHGADPVDFELWSLAVSAVNGCGMCIESHWKHLKEKGLTEAAVLASVRIASTLHAIAAVLEYEQAA